MTISKVLANALWVVLIAASSLVYLMFLAGSVPAKYALLVNLMVVPFLLGLLGFFVLKGSLLTKALLLALLPVFHVLYFGADSAKPGLENILAVLEVGFIALGIASGWLTQRIVRL